MAKTDAGNSFTRLALLASPTDRAQEAAVLLGDSADWVPLEKAEAAVVLGGDGFMLETMHRMIDVVPTLRRVATSLMLASPAIT